MFIYQIFYNDETFNKLDKGFISLDNSENERPDWYEFWPIYNFLKKNTLIKNKWYGFFSTSFYEKTKIKSEVLKDFLKKNESFDVALFSHSLDQIGYFKNPFFQANITDPEILYLSQKALKSIDINLNLTTLVSHSLSTVYSNYLVAKPAYWEKWLYIAEKFFQIAESKNNNLAKLLNIYSNNYGSKTKKVQLKVFIQERFPTIIFLENKLKVITYYRPEYTLNTKMFKNNIYTKSLLQICDLLKIKYVTTKNQKYYNMYVEMKELIPINFQEPNLKITKNL